MLADTINYNYYQDYPELQIRYQPTLTWNNNNKGNKNIHKIGIRATNSLVSASKEDDSFAMFTRSEIINRYSLDLYYDVSSSVPRLTLSINQGKWIDELDIQDIYELIYLEYERIREEESRESRYIGTIGNTCKFNREAVKKLFMSVYFDETSDKNIGNHLIYKMKDKSDRRGVYDQIAYLKQATINVLGESDFSEIFFHESNIYMEVLNELLEQGFFVWQVYDCWFAHKDGVTQSEYQELVSQIVKEKADRYIKKIAGE